MIKCLKVDKTLISFTYRLGTFIVPVAKKCFCLLSFVLGGDGSMSKVQESRALLPISIEECVVL